MSGVSLCHPYLEKYEEIQASLKSHPKISQLHDRPNVNFYLPSLILIWRLISEKKKKEVKCIDWVGKESHQNSTVMQMGNSFTYSNIAKK